MNTRTMAILTLSFFSLTALLLFHIENTVSLKKTSVNFVPPLGFIKFISGTFESFWADIFYIRGIMAITGEFEHREEKTFWVQQNLKLATDLDPELIQAYFFGGSVIGWDEESIKMGIKFLKQARSKKPNEWRIPYWIGFNYYELGKYLKAIEYFKKASKLPDAPDYLKSGQPMLYYKAGEAKLGVQYLQGLLHSINDPKQLEWIKTKLEWLKNIVELEKKINQFKQLFTREPKDLEELVAKGLIDKVPEDPFLGGYYYDKKLSQVRSKPKELPQQPGQESKPCPACAK